VAKAVDPEFDACLKTGKIRRFADGRELAPAEMKAARHDLDESRRSLAAEGYKWATIQAYYAMFHTARALVYARGYRERSHRCLVIALRALYASGGDLELEYVEGFQAGKTLRENADYYGNFSKEAAAKAVDLDSAFHDRALGLLAKR
jgi:uncharacterized protein (UPF0332 family)